MGHRATDQHARTVGHRQQAISGQHTHRVEPGTQELRRIRRGGDPGGPGVGGRQLDVGETRKRGGRLRRFQGQLIVAHRRGGPGLPQGLTPAEAEPVEGAGAGEPLEFLGRQPGAPGEIGDVEVGTVGPTVDDALRRLLPDAAHPVETQPDIETLVLQGGVRE